MFTMMMSNHEPLTVDRIKKLDMQAQCTRQLRQLVKEIEAAQIVSISVGLLSSSSMLVALAITVVQLVIPPDEAVMSDNTVLCIGIVVLIMLFSPCALILRRLIYVERRDKKIEELRSAMTLAKLGYGEALEALKKSDPKLAKKIIKYIK